MRIQSLKEDKNVKNVKNLIKKIKSYLRRKAK
jgi:hypothetical protein